MNATATQPVQLPRNMVVPTMTPLLKARIEAYKAAMPPFAPVYDRIFVYPLDDKDLDEKTDSGLYVPDSTRDQVGAQRGILMAAGAKALEQLYSHGIGIGHIVITARLSPWARKYLARGVPHFVLTLRASEVVASEDLLRAYEKGDVWLEMTPEGEVQLCDRESSRRPTEAEGNWEGI